MINVSKLEVLDRRPIWAQMKSWSEKWKDKFESHGGHYFYWYFYSIQSNQYPIWQDINYNKDSVNNTVYCPDKDSKEITDCPDGRWIEGAVMIILVNSIEIFNLVPLCTWAWNSLLLLLLISMYFHIQLLSIPHFIQNQ